VRAPHLLEGLDEILRGNSLSAQERAGRSALLLGQRQQQVLGGDVGVTHLPRVLFGAIEHAMELAAERRLRPALLLGKAHDLALELIAQPGDVDPRLLEERLDYALRLLDQSPKQVSIIDHRIAPAARFLRRVAKRLLSLDRHSIRSDHHNPFSIRGLHAPPHPARQVPFPEYLPKWQAVPIKL
jgi:hypothetical protein